MATLAPERFAAIRAAIEVAFPVRGVEVQDGRPVFEVDSGADAKARFLRLRSDLDVLGVLPLLRCRGGRTVLLLAPKPASAPNQWTLPGALFLATLLTTFLAGYFDSSVGHIPGLTPLGGGIAFSLSLMGILVCHEMGHKLVSIWRGIDASLPFFIPMPPLPGIGIGTLGAVIVTRTPAPNRDALVELGASGPIAGFLAAIPVLVYGVSHSAVIAHSAVLANTCQIPTPWLVDLLTQWLLRPGPAADVIIHPVAFAGWVGLLVTALNLLPGGMLDGGHVMRAVFGGRAHLVLSVAAAGVAFLYKYYLMGLLILILLRRGHPGPLDDCSAVTPGRLAMAGSLIAIFALSAVPLTLSCQ